MIQKVKTMNILEKSNLPYQVIHSKSELLISKSQCSNGYHHMPENYGEIIYNPGSRIDMKLINSVRVREIPMGTVYISPSRNKGLVFYPTADLHCIIIRINPIYIPALRIFNDHLYEKSKLEVSSPQKFYDLLLKFMEMAKPMEVDSIIQQSIEMIEQSEGEIQVKELYESLNISKSSLEKKFSRLLEISPKEFCKIEKMKNFLKNYKMYKASMNLTQLTFKSGYYDQSHLIKDFRYFMDMKPTEYFKMI